MEKIIKIFIKQTIFILIFLSVVGCSTKKDDMFVKSIFQTNGATAVRMHIDSLKSYLLKYKIKLDKRNPNFYSKESSKIIIHEIESESYKIVLEKFKNRSNVTYKDYLNMAFSKDYVKNRNDYLILGIYKLLYWAYTIERTYTVTAMQYDVQKIQEANKTMQIVQYKIQTATDKNGNYLFLTWQRAWQVELLKDINSGKKRDLDRYTTKELLYHSNMSFQVISSSMIFTIQETLRYLGSETVNLSTQAIKSVFMFL